MIERPNSMEMQFRCDQCGTAAGIEMRNCPRRSQQRCPFTVKEHRPGRRYLGMFILGFGMLFAAMGAAFPAFMLWRYGVTAGALVATSIFLLLFMAFGLFCAYLGSYLAFGWQVSFFNQTTGQLWQLHRLLGLELARVVVCGTEPISLRCEPLARISYPASLALLRDELSWKEVKQLARESARLSRQEGQAQVKRLEKQLSYGEEVFEAALLSLWSEDRVRLSQIRPYSSKFGGKLRNKHGTQLLVVPGRSEGGHPPDGVLEQRIVEIVDHWDEREGAAEQPLGPTVKLLVQALFDDTQTDPSAWLASVAQKDGVARGVLKKTEGLFACYKIEAAHTTQMKVAHSKVKQWCAKVIQSHAALSEGLRREVAEGLKARTEGSG
jgi:hypothetical protein